MDIKPSSWNALRYSNTLTRMDGVLEITSLRLCSNMLDLAFLSPINLTTALLLWYDKHPKMEFLALRK